MTLMENIEDLVNEHYQLLESVESNKQILINTLVENNMAEFFSINWRRLHNEFLRKRLHHHE